MFDLVRRFRAQHYRKLVWIIGLVILVVVIIAVPVGGH